MAYALTNLGLSPVRLQFSVEIDWRHHIDRLFNNPLGDYSGCGVREALTSNESPIDTSKHGTATLPCTCCNLLKHKSAHQEVCTQSVILFRHYFHET